MATKTIDRLHREHRLWINKLDFLQDEIQCFLDGLNQLLNNNQDVSCKQCISDYMLQLHTSADQIRLFKGAILIHESYLAERAHKGQHLELDHDEPERKIKEFFRSFDKLKKQLKSFMAETRHKNLEVTA